MDDVVIQNGAARVPGGTYLVSPEQPVATRATTTLRGQTGFLVPDRAAVRRLEATGDVWCADSARPFLTRLDALPDEQLNLVSGKLLVAPASARVSARRVKLVPMSLRFATVVTEFRGGWAVAATRGRLTRVALAEGETLTVRPEALVAWTGKDPTGVCPKLGVLDLILPRGPKSLAFRFYGPSVVWFEGSFVAPKRAAWGGRR